MGRENSSGDIGRRLALKFDPAATDLTTADLAGFGVNMGASWLTSDLSGSLPGVSSSNSFSTNFGNAMMRETVSTGINGAASGLNRMIGAENRLVQTFGGMAASYAQGYMKEREWELARKAAQQGRTNELANLMRAAGYREEHIKQTILSLSSLGGYGSKDLTTGSYAVRAYLGKVLGIKNGAEGEAMMTEITEQLKALSRDGNTVTQEMMEFVIRDWAGADAAGSVNWNAAFRGGDALKRNDEVQYQKTLDEMQSKKHTDIALAVNTTWNRAMQAVFGSQTQSGGTPGYNMTHRSGADIRMVDGKIVAASDPQAVMAWESKTSIERRYDSWRYENRRRFTPEYQAKVQDAMLSVDKLIKANAADALWGQGEERLASYDAARERYASLMQMGGLSEYQVEALRVKLVQLDKERNQFAKHLELSEDRVRLAGLNRIVEHTGPAFVSFATSLYSASNGLMPVAIAAGGSAAFNGGEVILGWQDLLSPGGRSTEAFLPSMVGSEYKDIANHFQQGIEGAGPMMLMGTPTVTSSIPQMTTKAFPSRVSKGWLTFNTVTGGGTGVFNELINNPDATLGTTIGAGLVGAGAGFGASYASGLFQGGPLGKAIMSTTMTAGANLGYTAFQIGPENLGRKQFQTTAMLATYQFAGNYGAERLQGALKPAFGNSGFAEAIPQMLKFTIWDWFGGYHVDRNLR